MNASSPCRACSTPLHQTVADLGLSPISNAFIKMENAAKGEMFYPLHALVCDHCWLVQLGGVTEASAHFHDDYVYFSSYSHSWVEHAHRYVEGMITRFGLNPASRVMELASNDGYLLQHVVQAGIPCLGIEPSANTAAAARKKGIESREIFFTRHTAAQLAHEGWQVDLLLGNNVLAHVPDINDFVSAMPAVLKPQGVITLEFPHLQQLLAENQFDTLYHEHYSYLSLTALLPIFARAGLRFFDVEHLPTHGGSLRVYACHINAMHTEAGSVATCLEQEKCAGLTRLETYAAFGKKVVATKSALLEFLIDAKRHNKSIAAYGAAAKGNTLLNYCGVGTDFIDYVVDKNPVKQGRLLPGSRIPVRSPDMLFDTRPDYLLILPWNLKHEVMAQMADIRSWGGRFVVPIPQVEVLS